MTKQQVLSDPIERCLQNYLSERKTVWCLKYRFQDNWYGIRSRDLLFDQQESALDFFRDHLMDMNHRVNYDPSKSLEEIIDEIKASGEIEFTINDRTKICYQLLKLPLEHPYTKLEDQTESLFSSTYHWNSCFRYIYF